MEVATERTGAGVVRLMSGSKI